MLTISADSATPLYSSIKITKSRYYVNSSRFVFLLAGCTTSSQVTVEGKGISIPNFHKVNENLYRGARPRKQGIEELKGLGIKTIVNLEREIFEKEPGEVKKERQWAEEAGIRFFHVPMHPFFAPKREEIERALAYITESSNHPVFVHCDRGSDRTGIVIAAYRIKIDGWSIDMAYEEMKKYGHRSILLCWWKNSLLSIKTVDKKYFKA